MATDRRGFLSQVTGAVAASCCLALDDRGVRAAGPDAAGPDAAGAPLDIGGRRELFIDRALIQRLDGAEQRLQHPEIRERVLEHNAPWEGTGSGYHSVFADGGRYRMYYKAWHLAPASKKLVTNRHPLYCCYAESDDGIAWRKPDLGLHEFEGSTRNNIVLASGPLGKLNLDAGHPAVFKDENPEAAPEARYKGLFRSSNPNGLLPFKSPDGIHWSPLTESPILSGLGAFDSQNLAFWDPTLGKYRAYWRIFTTVKGGGPRNDSDKPQSYRAIRTAVSDDLIHWGPHRDLDYVDSPIQQLYTNQIKPYHRAPHLLIGFPTRYIDRGWSESMKALPEREQRELRASSSQRYGTAVTDALLMVSRDGVLFHRWNEAFLRPGIERPGTWHYGHQYVAWHAVETASALPGAPNELSLYATERYWHGAGTVVRRHTLRLDGFVSIHAPLSGGQLLTRPLIFEGRRLRINAATSAAGALRIELQSPAGEPLPGFSLADCDEFFGDAIDRPVTWKQGSDLSALQGQPLRLRVELKDADLYSLQFG